MLSCWGGKVGCTLPSCKWRTHIFYFYWCVGGCAHSWLEFFFLLSLPDWNMGEHFWSATFYASTSHLNVTCKVNIGLSVAVFNLLTGNSTLDKYAICYPWQSSSSFGALKTLSLYPVAPLFWLRHRAELLGHMKPCESQSSTASGPESGNWTLVDEGGEEVSRGKRWLKNHDFKLWFWKHNVMIFYITFKSPTPTAI